MKAGNRVTSNTHQRRIALVGNPNVGKSTLFNSLTGLRQHTGNWSGKTVGAASGKRKGERCSFIFYDLPGTYSLTPHSEEEACTRDFLICEEYDAIIAVCDCARLERSLFLVLEMLQISKNIIVCLNLCREGERSGISVDEEKLSSLLSLPVIKTDAKKKSSADELCDLLEKTLENITTCDSRKTYIEKEEAIASELCALSDMLSQIYPDIKASRFIAQAVISGDTDILSRICKWSAVHERGDIFSYVEKMRIRLSHAGYDQNKITDVYTRAVSLSAKRTYSECVKEGENKKLRQSERIDSFLTGRVTAFPVMILLLMLILWLTVSGANIVSGYLSSLLFSLEAPLLSLLVGTGLPYSICDSLAYGVYRMLAWVVSVMLPPMAIFFPLFTLLEDIGYLPRIAYNLDRPFMRCNACGKQSLTMCMGLGCNAAGVTGCRIIDSPRERMLAILTNSFIPCNGKIPALTTVIYVFFVFGLPSLASFGISAAIMTLLIVISVLATLLFTRLLSATLLKGLPSSFVLEMPPFRAPKVGQILVRSFLDRTLFVLGRAVCVAAPFGLAVYLLANVYVGDESLLMSISSFLDPFASLMGLDGIILISFILGICANETVIPIMLMAYTQGSALIEFEDLSALRSLLISNGWDTVTAVSFIILMLFHSPCSTTLLTIKKESGSVKYTLISALLPSALGVLMCMLVNALFG